MRTIFAVVIFCLLPLFVPSADENDRILVYYFKNLTEETGYDELTYGIPHFLYDRLSESARSSKVVLIDRGGLQLRDKERSVDLWKTGSLINIARRRGFDQVLYGAFFVFEGRPVIAGKVLYAKSGLVLDVTEKETAYHRTIGEAERKTAEEIMGAGERAPGGKGYSPPFTRAFGSPVVQKNRSLSGHVGPLLPLGKWAEIYPPGLLGDVSFAFFPKMNIFPLGLGVNANCSLLSREAGTLAESSILAFGLGATLQYKLVLKRLNKGVVFDVGSGMAMSLLTANSETLPSFDPYVKAGASLLLSTRRKASISLKGGVYSINYRTVPIDSVYIQVGFRGG